MGDAFKHDLGDRAKDRISGLTGIITARAEHLFGCARYWISPEGEKDGKPHEGAWLDEDAIDVVEKGAVARRIYRVVEAEDLRVPDSAGKYHEPEIETFTGRVARGVRQLAGGPVDQPPSGDRGRTK